MSWRPREAPTGRQQRGRLILFVALVAMNCGVIWYHGDPRDRLPEVERTQQTAVAEIDEMALERDYQPTLGLRTPGVVQRVDTVRLERNQTAAAALIGAGVKAEVAGAAIHSLAPIVDFRRLRPGDFFKARFDAQGDLVSLDVVRGLLEQARAEKGSGTWSAQLLEVPVDTVLSEIRGTVQSSLWQALVEDAGEDPRLVHEIVDVFAWDIDFYTEVFPGDTFRLLVDKRFAEGKLVDYGPILAAEFVTAGDPHRAFMHRSADGAVSYFDERGQSLRKQLLKAPLKYANVTSTFGSRRHPVLGYTRAHNGIDYGVPVGTPIWSVGDGRVTRAGWNGGFGKFIEIRHANGWVSQYAHLSRIDVRAGQRVSQKQIVGAVGSTGLSTGPHLHYGLLRGGAYVNPLVQKFERGRPLEGAERDRYLKSVADLTQRLEGIRYALAEEPKG